MGAFAAAGLLLLTHAVWAAQQPAIRTTAEEVLVDFVARDKRGRIVRNLRADEVEVFEDGVAQKLKSFRLVEPRLETEPERPPAGPPAAAPPGPEKTPAPSAAEHRIASLVFDRLGPGAGRQLAIEAAREFVAHQAPGTYVGLFVLNARLYVVQPYTNDRERLLKAVEQISAGGESMFRTLSGQLELQLLNDVGKGGTAGSSLSTPQAGFGSPSGTASMSEALRRESLRELPAPGAAFTVVAPAEVSGPRPFQQMLAKVFEFENRAMPPTLDRTNLYSLMALIHQQAALPGRKAMLLMTEGLHVPPAFNYLVRSAVSEANRSQVTIYTLDVRGLSPQAAIFEGRGQLAAATAASAEMISNSYSNDFRVFDRAEISLSAGSQAVMRDLAESTGGFFIGNTNDVRGPMRRMVEELAAQYELSYRPTAAAYDGRFRGIEVRLRRPGLHVQARKGYFALPAIGGQTLFPFEMALLSALTAPGPTQPFPFAARLAQFRPGDRLREALIAFEVPRTELTLAEEDTANLRTRVALLALLRDDQGRIVQKISRDIHLRVPRDRREAFLRGNLIFVEPFRTPAGQYQLETAVLDGEGKRVSARRAPVTVEPASGLALSSLVLARQVEVLDQPADPNDPLQFEDKAVTPAVSGLFRQSVHPELSLYCVVYPDPAAKDGPELTLEFLKDGQPVSHLNSQLSLNGGGIPFLARFPTAEFAPGRYEAVVSVRQRGATARRQTEFTVER